MQSASDNITQLQNQVFLLSSQLASCTGAIQRDAPALGLPLKIKSEDSAGVSEKASQDFNVMVNQGIEEIMQTSKTINQLIDRLPEPVSDNDILKKLAELDDQSKLLDAELADELQVADDMLIAIRETLRTITK